MAKPDAHESLQRLFFDQKRGLESEIDLERQFSYALSEISQNLIGYLETLKLPTGESLLGLLNQGPAEVLLPAATMAFHVRVVALMNELGMSFVPSPMAYTEVINQLKQLPASPAVSYVKRLLMHESGLPATVTPSLLMEPDDDELEPSTTVSHLEWEAKNPPSRKHLLIKKALLGGLLLGSMTQVVAPVVEYVHEIDLRQKAKEQVTDFVQSTFPPEAQGVALVGIDRYQDYVEQHGFSVPTLYEAIQSGELPAPEDFVKIWLLPDTAAEVSAEWRLNALNAAKLASAQEIYAQARPRLDYIETFEFDEPNSEVERWRQKQVDQIMEQLQSTTEMPAEVATQMRSVVRSLVTIEMLQHSNFWYSENQGRYQYDKAFWLLDRFKLESLMELGPNFSQELVALLTSFVQPEVTELDYPLVLPSFLEDETVTANRFKPLLALIYHAFPPMHSIEDRVALLAQVMSDPAVISLQMNYFNTNWLLYLTEAGVDLLNWSPEQIALLFSADNPTGMYAVISSANDLGISLDDVGISDLNLFQRYSNSDVRVAFETYSEVHTVVPELTLGEFGYILYYYNQYLPKQLPLPDFVYDTMQQARKLHISPGVYAQLATDAIFLNTLYLKGSDKYAEPFSSDEILQLVEQYFLPSPDLGEAALVYRADLYLELQRFELDQTVLKNRWPEIDDSVADVVANNGRAEVYLAFMYDMSGHTGMALFGDKPTMFVRALTNLYIQNHELLEAIYDNSQERPNLLYNGLTSIYTPFYFITNNILQLPGLNERLIEQINAYSDSLFKLGERLRPKDAQDLDATIIALSQENITMLSSTEELLDAVKQAREIPGVHLGYVYVDSTSWTLESRPKDDSFVDERELKVVVPMIMYGSNTVILSAEPLPNYDAVLSESINNPAAWPNRDIIVIAADGIVRAMKSDEFSPDIAGAKERVSQENVKLLCAVNPITNPDGSLIQNDTIQLWSATSRTVTFVTGSGRMGVIYIPDAHVITDETITAIKAELGDDVQLFMSDPGSSLQVFSLEKPRMVFTGNYTTSYQEIIATIVEP